MRTRHDARISFVDGFFGFPQGVASLYLIHKRINICDTNTFKTIAAVSAKFITDQFKCTHEMEFESIVNQILLTKSTADFPNLLISTCMNNNKTWE